MTTNYADRPKKPVQFTLDEETRQQLEEIAKQFENNSSAAIRALVRKEFQRLQRRKTALFNSSR